MTCPRSDLTPPAHNATRSRQLVSTCSRTVKPRDGGLAYSVQRQQRHRHTRRAGSYPFPQIQASVGRINQLTEVDKTTPLSLRQRLDQKPPAPRTHQRRARKRQMRFHHAPEVSREHLHLLATPGLREFPPFVVRGIAGIVTDQPCNPVAPCRLGLRSVICPRILIIRR